MKTEPSTNGAESADLPDPRVEAEPLRNRLAKPSIGSAGC